MVPGWSLNYEMLFYAVFALAIALSAWSARLRFGLISGMLLAILLVADLTKSRIDVMNFYANPILFEFVAGVVLAIVWRMGIAPRSWLWLMSSIAGFGLLWLGTHSPVGFIAILMGASLIVTGAVFLPPLRHNPLSALGDASYSLYLTHALTLGAFALLWEDYLSGLPWQLFVLAGCSVAIVIALCMYNFFEVPVTAALKAHSRHARLSDSMPAPARPPVRRTQRR